MGSATTASAATNSATTNYGYIDSTDTPAYATNAAGTLLETYIALPGGVILPRRSQSDIWCYPNLHGDVMGIGWRCDGRWMCGHAVPRSRQRQL
ncbi:MAG: hypothetical protein ACT4OS_01885 [Acidimicrobiales bacterium]